MALDILLVEDQTDLSQVWSDFLAHLGHRVRLVDSVAGARALLAGGMVPELAIVDWSLADGYADALVAEIRTRHPSCYIALTTGHGEEVAEAFGSRVQVVLRKPFSLRDLAKIVASVG